jgi:hypothetical protein
MRWREAVAAVAVALLLAGCTPATGLVVTTSDEGHVLLVEARDDGVHPLAEVTGTLVAVGACFGLKTDSGTYPTVFPPGSSIVEGTEQVEIPHWGTLGAGDELHGGGGYFSPGDLDYGDRIPDACRADEIVVVNPFG